MFSLKTFDNYGSVLLSKNLDYEHDREYKLKITGADGKTSDFGFLYIKVKALLKKEFTPIDCKSVPAQITLYFDSC